VDEAQDVSLFLGRFVRLQAPVAGAPACGE
jgi:hypothetical protein